MAYTVRNTLMTVYISGLFAMGISPLVKMIERRASIPVGTRVAAVAGDPDHLRGDHRRDGSDPDDRHPPARRTGGRAVAQPPGEDRPGPASS